jgi:hypothetical protein
LSTVMRPGLTTSTASKVRGPPMSNQFPLTRSSSRRSPTVPMSQRSRATEGGILIQFPASRR